MPAKRDLFTFSFSQFAHVGYRVFREKSKVEAVDKKERERERVPECP